MLRQKEEGKEDIREVRKKNTEEKCKREREAESL